MAFVELDRLTYWYPNATVPALADARASIDGGLTLVTGPSGGGKSTLLRVLNGLVPHFHGGRFAGNATVGGHAVARTPTRLLARDVGFVFQDPEAQFIYGGVQAEVAFGLENVRTAPSLIRERVDEVLARLGIAHLRQRRVDTLSGGEKQRVALACALALRPRLIALDEPTSQLDDEGADALVGCALDLAREGVGIVIAEHRIDRLVGVAASAIRVDGGRVATGIDIPKRRGRALAKAELRPGTTAWSLDGVAVRFDGRELLGSINLAGIEGAVTVLVGPNGSGKTTLLRTIAGLRIPDAGQVEHRPGRVAYLPQNPTALLHRQTVRAEIELTLGSDRRSAHDELERFGLLAIADRYPRDLSTGEKQRVALGATLAGHPSIALLDEPTRGMDETARSQLIDTVARVRAEGTSVVIATHDTELALELGDEVIALGDGVARRLAA